MDTWPGLLALPMLSERKSTLNARGVRANGLLRHEAAVGLDGVIDMVDSCRCLNSRGDSAAGWAPINVGACVTAGMTESCGNTTRKQELYNKHTKKRSKRKHEKKTNSLDLLRKRSTKVNAPSRHIFGMCFN